jgi:CrcB protein
MYRCASPLRDRFVTTVIAIGAGGALGSVLRYLLGRLIQGGTHAAFPVGTLTVNILGCALVGALSRYFLNNEVHPILKSALIVGFCGGFTTFSAFSIETVGLLSGGAVGKALLYVLMSVTLCLAATALGFFAAR